MNERAFLAVKNAMVDATVDLMPDDDITDCDVNLVIKAYEAALWQPIETAPKDVVIILAEGDWVTWGQYRPGYGWMSFSIKLNPTHWRHLPAPPSKGTQL